MSGLIREIVSEYEAYSSSFHLALLLEPSRLPPERWETLRSNERYAVIPLLTQPEFANLAEIAPVLLSHACKGTDGIHALSSLARTIRPALCGWLTSRLPSTEIAAHLARANVMHAPDGDAYLFRWHAPHATEALFKARDAWSHAFFGPLISWWSLTPDPDVDRWRHYPGSALTALPDLRPLRAQDPLWTALTEQNAEPYRVLSNLERLEPPVFDTDCPGQRLGQVGQLLAQAREQGFVHTQDRQDYALLRLRGGDSLERDPRWHAALRRAVNEDVGLLAPWIAHSS